MYQRPGRDEVMYSREVIDEVISRNDIVDVISGYVKLKKNGSSYTGLCPFHNEKSPSFSVSGQRQLYHCFGCGVGGNVITFVMEYENMTFLEAVKMLGERAGVALPQTSMSEEDRKERGIRDRLLEINKIAATYYYRQLRSEKGKNGLDYLKKRELSDSTINSFGLGYATQSTGNLYKLLKDKGYDDDILKESGLFTYERGIHEKFWNRVIFPIMDINNKVIGFGGRVMGDAKPKYLNSPETRLFDKSRNLYGLNIARTSRKPNMIICEGYMDVISAHNHGVTNVVASLGTAYTRDHGHILMRQAEEIVLAYDMDGAGRQAAARAIELLQNTDFKVRVLAMPDGKDPDDYVRNHGGQAFKELVAKAVKPLDYLLSESLIKHDTNDTEGKQAVMADVFPYIANIDSQTQRDDALKTLALPLWLDNSTIFRYFRDYVKKGQIELVDTASAPLPTQDLPKGDAEKLLSLAFTDGEVLQHMMSYLPLEDFEKIEYRGIIEKLFTLYKSEGRLDETAIQSVLSSQEYDIYSRLVVMSDDEYKVQVPALIRKIRLHSLREQYKAHSIMADQLKRAGDSTFISELHKCQEIQNLIREWSK